MATGADPAIAYGHPAPEHVHNLMLAYQSPLFDSTMAGAPSIHENTAVFQLVTAMKSAGTRCARLEAQMEQATG